MTDAHTDCRLKFSLALLEKEPVTLDGEFPPEFLDLEENEMLHASGPVAYHLEAQLVTGNVTVIGRVSCPIEGECGRCLDPVSGMAEANRIALFYDELGDAEELDVTEDVRTELVLALPMNLLCSPDCKGLCPRCGANLNHEPCRCRPADAAGTEPEEPDSSPWSALDGLK